MEVGILFNQWKLDTSLNELVCLIKIDSYVFTGLRKIVGQVIVAHLSAAHNIATIVLWLLACTFAWRCCLLLRNSLPLKDQRKEKREERREKRGKSTWRAKPQLSGSPRCFLTVKGFVAVCFCCRCYGHEGNADFFRLCRNLKSILPSCSSGNRSDSDCNLNCYSIETVAVAPNMLCLGIWHAFV